MQNIIIIPGSRGGAPIIIPTHSHGSNHKHCSCVKEPPKPYVNPNGNIKVSSFDISWGWVFFIVLFFMIGIAIKSAFD